MKALKKIFQKNVRAMVVLLMAMGLTTLLPSWTAEGGPGKDNGKGKKAKTEVRLKKVAKNVFEDPDAVWFKLKDGITPNLINAQNPENYELVEGNTPPCSGEELFCGVKASNDGNDLPELGSSTQAFTAIDNYFNHSTNTPALISQRDSD